MTTNSQQAVTEALKPCPFCGGANIGWTFCETYSLDSSYATFGCLSCQVSFPAKATGETPADRAEWNRRATAQAQAEPLNSQIDRLASFIMAEVPGEPSRSEGAVDTAIRWMRAAISAQALAKPVEVADGDALSAIADYLELRDESVGPDEADEAERTESAREILAIVALHRRVASQASTEPTEPIRFGKATPITAEEARDRVAKGLHVEWAEGVGRHYFPAWDAPESKP